MSRKFLNDSKIIDLIREILWPGGDADHEWTQDTIEEIALILTENGKGPEVQS